MKLFNLIFQLDTIIENLSDRMTRRQIKALNCVIKQQIPTIPNYDKCTDRVACCPTCGLFLLRAYKPKYCQECGQALDWKEEKG